MPSQSYRDRVERRPGYASFKNRKKTIRRRWQAGRITAEERERLLAEAAERYRSDPEARPPALDPETARRVEAWLATRPHGDHCGDESCLGARWRRCTCQCDGAWHGAALGHPPLWHARTAEPQRCADPDCRTLHRPCMPTQRYCSARCGDRHRRALARRRTKGQWACTGWAHPCDRPCCRFARAANARSEAAS